MAAAVKSNPPGDSYLSMGTLGPNTANQQRPEENYIDQVRHYFLSVLYFWSKLVVLL